MKVGKGKKTMADIPTRMSVKMGAVGNQRRRDSLIRQVEEEKGYEENQNEVEVSFRTSHQHRLRFADDSANKSILSYTDDQKSALSTLATDDPSLLIAELEAARSQAEKLQQHLEISKRCNVALQKQMVRLSAANLQLRDEADHYIEKCVDYKVRYQQLAIQNGITPTTQEEEKESSTGFFDYLPLKYKQLTSSSSPASPSSKNQVFGMTSSPLSLEAMTMCGGEAPSICATSTRNVVVGEEDEARQQQQQQERKVNTSIEEEKHQAPTGCQAQSQKQAVNANDKDSKDWFNPWFCSGLECVTSDAFACGELDFQNILGGFTPDAREKIQHSLAKAPNGDQREGNNAGLSATPLPVTSSMAFNYLYGPCFVGNNPTTTETSSPTTVDYKPRATTGVALVNKENEVATTREEANSMAARHPKSVLRSSQRNRISVQQQQKIQQKKETFQQARDAISILEQHGTSARRRNSRRGSIGFGGRR